MDIKEIQEMHDSRNQRLKEISGNVVMTDSLASFFYSLMRDHVPAGVVEKLVRESTTGPGECHYSNGFLARYAQNLADELRDGRKKALTEALDAAFTDDSSRAGSQITTPDDVEEKYGALDITNETVQKIEKAYENMSIEEKAKAERELETGESDEMKQMVTDIEQVFDNEETKDEGRSLTDKLLDEAEQSKNTVEQVLEDRVNTLKKAAEMQSRNWNDSDPSYSKEAFESMADESKPAMTKAQSDREDTVQIPKPDTTKAELQHRAQVQAALDAISKIKDLVPSESVVEVTKILFKEVEQELGGGDDSEPEGKKNGAFRRVHSDLDIKDDEVSWSEG